MDASVHEQTKRQSTGDTSGASAPVQVVDFTPPVVPRGARGDRVSSWRRIRRAWREWRIGRTPRHRHTFGQRMQFRWWRRQDRLQRRRAQGLARGFDPLAGVFLGVVALTAVALIAYVIVFAV